MLIFLVSEINTKLSYHVCSEVTINRWLKEFKTKEKIQSKANKVWCLVGSNLSLEATMTTMMIIDLASIWSFKLYTRALEYHWTWSVVEELLLQKGWNSERDNKTCFSEQRPHILLWYESRLRKIGISKWFSLTRYL